MSLKGELTREEAVKAVGESAVTAAESSNCEPTNRVGYNGAPQGDTLIEWCASAEAEDADGNECRVEVYFYTTQEEIDEAGDDLSNVDWEISGYAIG